jgi:hypothetical protein
LEEGKEEREKGMMTRRTRRGKEIDEKEGKERK